MLHAKFQGQLTSGSEKEVCFKALMILPCIGMVAILVIGMVAVQVK